MSLTETQEDAAAALRSVLLAEAVYRVLADGLVDCAIFMADTDGRICNWNDGARILTGFTADDAIGKHVSFLYDSEARTAGIPEREIHRATVSGAVRGEGWRVRRDGSRYRAYAVLDAIRLPGGELLGFGGILRDVTERHEAEEALRKSEEHFRVLVEGVTDYAIYMLGPDGEVSSWNSGAQRIKGYTADEIIGQNFSRFYTPEDREAGEPQRVLGIATREGRFEAEGRRVRKDGSTFWAHVVIDALHDDNGVLVGFAKVTRDITEQRRTRERLDAARESLFQMQKMDALGQLTGGVAHDFNNLLMAILGSLELLGKRLPEDDERAALLLKNATLGAQRGAALTQRLLAFARRQELRMQPVDVLGLIQGMRELIGQSVGGSVEIETRLPLQLPAVQADPNHLELALLNLLLNARDAMPGGGTIVVRARELTVMDPKLGSSANFVSLSISDGGIGMDAATMARAREPFFTTKGVGRGTGLGLPMVDGFAQQCGGRLVLRSEPGRGTTAEIQLPVSVETPQPEVAVQPAESLSEESLCVLVVDDDGLVLGNTVALLEDLGHRVTGVTSAREALDLLQSDNEIELLITDHLMPGMTGAQLIDAVRQSWPHLQCIVVSGFRELSPDLAAGAPRLAKPFSQQQLRNMLRQMRIPPPVARMRRSPASVA